MATKVRYLRVRQGKVVYPALMPAAGTAVTVRKESGGLVGVFNVNASSRFTAPNLATILGAPNTSKRYTLSWTV